MKLFNKLAIILFFAAMPAALCAQQQLFTDKQITAISCAKEKLVALYNYLDPALAADKKEYSPSACGTASKPLPPPKWLQTLLTDEMESRVLWELPGEKGRKEYLNEAEMWRRAILVIYNFLDLVEKINDGTAYSYQQIMEQFGVLRTNLLVETDRLNTDPWKINYNMRDSMQGRGRSLLATLDLINKQMDSVAESFVNSPKQWRIKFKKSVMGIVILSNSLYGDIVNNAPLPQPDTAKKGGSNSSLIFVLMILGMMAIFFSVYKLVSDKNTEIETAVQKYLQRTSSVAEDYNRQFLDINVKYIVLGTVGFFTLLGALFAVLIGGFFGIVVLGIFFGIGCYFGLKMPGQVLNFLKKRRGEKINSQLMDALILLSNSLKSGMDIVQGFEMVSQDLHPPISDEFALVIKNYKLGSPFEKALEGMEERVESRLLSYMVKAIVLQRQVGGNLTKIFERIVENIREESKLEEKLQAMTAQQRIQALVVGIMPAIMVGIMFVFQPDTMINFYSKPIGIFTFLFCAFWIFLGIKMVNKLGEIKV